MVYLQVFMGYHHKDKSSMKLRMCVYVVMTKNTLTMSFPVPDALQSK